MEIEFRTINNTPVFSVPGDSPHWGRVYGATFDKRGSRWFFPAFPPFIDNVLQDFVNVHADVPLSEEAEGWVKKAGTAEGWQGIAANLKLPTESYEHQTEGLAQLLHNYRWILNWEMGTGKSKVVIDTINYLKTKTLILCPRIALDNWDEEIKQHSDGELTTVVMDGASKIKKMEQLDRFKDKDVLIATYGTARIYGTPQLFPKTVKSFKRIGLVPTPTVKTILKSINDEETQVRLAFEWAKGKKPKEMRQEVAELTEGKPQWIFSMPYETMVIDESHRIKRIQSSQTKICLQLSQKATRRYALSGTLTQGDPRNLFPQLKYLAPYLIPEQWEPFCEMFLETSPYNNKVVTGYKNIHILNARVAEVSSQKKLTECVDLPERRFITVYFDLSPGQRRDYNNVVTTNTIERPGGDIVEIANGAIKIGKLLQLCSGFVYVPEELNVCDDCSKVRECVALSILPGSARCIKSFVNLVPTRTSLRYPKNPKIDVLRDLLEDVLQDAKTIVWASFEQELDDISEMLDKQGWRHVRVDGSTTKDIKRLAAEFTNNTECKVYLAQISTGIAVTLNIAAYAIYYSRDWNLDNRQQSLFRNYRIGQTKKTVVYDLCARGAIEVQQLTALHSKENIAKLLTDRVDCVLCNRYRKCLKESITPWTTDCILSTGVDKVIAKAKTI